MDKIIVNPSDVRALGDIVSPKTSTDFIGYNSSVSSSTDEYLGTVYTGAYKSGSYIEVTRVEDNGTDYSVSFFLKKNDGTVIDGEFVYLVVDDNEPIRTLTTTSESGFQIDKTGKDIHLKFYFEGNSTVAGCIKTMVLRESEVTALSLTGDKSIIQSSDTVNLVAEVTGENTNGAMIEFVRETTDGILISDSAEYTMNYSGLKTLFEITDLGNKWELSCNFKSTVESRLVIGSKSGFTGTNPTNSIFIGSPNSTIAYYGYRDTSTHTTDLSSVDITSYVSFKIAYNNGNVTFTINGTDYTLSNITIFNNVTDFVIGMVSWSNSATVYVKNIKLKVIGS